jgi:hypothetical protein
VWGSWCIHPHFLDLDTSGGDWSASRPGRFTHKERVFGTICIGGWVGSRASLDDLEKRSWAYRDSNSEPSVVQPITSRNTDYATLYHNITKEKCLTTQHHIVSRFKDICTILSCFETYVYQLIGTLQYIIPTVIACNLHYMRFRLLHEMEWYNLLREQRNPTSR